MRTAIGVNRSRGGKPAPLTLRCRGKIQLQWLGDGTCGRTHADSCAGVTPYCSLWAVGYDISCGSSDPLSPTVRRTRSGALAAPGEGQGILPAGIVTDLASRRRPIFGRRNAKERVP